MLNVFFFPLFVHVLPIVAVPSTCDPSLHRSIMFPSNENFFFFPCLLYLTVNL